MLNIQYGKMDLDKTIWSPIPQPKEIGREEAFYREQIIGFLREADAGMPIKELCRKHGFSETCGDDGHL